MYKVTDSPMCSCKKVEQSVDHILFDCKLLQHDRDRLEATVTWSENRPVSKDKLGIKFYKNFKEFMKIMLLDKV